MKSNDSPSTRSSRKVVTAGILVCMYLAAMESTVVTTAMPTIISRLGGLEIYSWVFSIYLLTSTVSIPVWGRMSDLHGRRRIYLLGIAMFVIGSALCGLSTRMWQLVLFRAVQGIGGGALVPLAQIVIGEIYTLVERARMQAVFSGVWGFASITGPILGGFITDHFSWNWVFFINIPIGIVAGAIIGLHLTDTAAAPHKDRSGIRRGILMALSLGLFLLYLMEASSGNRWMDWRYLGSLVLACILFFFYLHLEKRSKSHFMPTDLFSNKIFVAGSANGACMGMVLFGVLAFVPLFAQGVQGKSATDAGRFITPVLLTWVFFSILMGYILKYTGFQKPVMIGMLLLIAGTGILTVMGQEPSPLTMAVAMICIGAGMGCNALPMLLAVQSAVPRQSLGIATSALQFFRSIGGAVGVAIMGSRFSTVVFGALEKRPNPELAALLRNPEVLLHTGDPGSNAGSMHLFRDILAAGLESAFFMALVFSVIGLVSAFLIPREAVFTTEPMVLPEP